MSVLSLLLSLPVRIYRRLLSPFLPPRCRFHPSCSAYALEALREHRPWHALALIGRRLSRCHPFHPGGFDWVPKA